MASQEPLYPAKRTPSPSGDFTIHQFFLPIRLNDEEVWALLDTGAHISILPKEIAEQILPYYATPTKTGTYHLAQLIEVPYDSYELDFEILEHIEGTIPEFNLNPYTQNANVAAQLRNIEFQVPQLTWSEIAENLSSDRPISVHSRNLDFVILGLYGVLDQLTLSFVGDNSVRVAPIGPR